MKLGVFDSGVGGLSVANAIQKALPEHEIILREDREHVPYGSRSPVEILEFVEPILSGMAAEGCSIIIVACNTVSTTLIGILRERIPVPLVAMEPMVKPAAEQTKSGIITVCATPATLGSDRYKWLKNTYGRGMKVLEPDCSDWSYMIEHKQIDRLKIAARIEDCLGQGSDVIVLGCTHYHWIEAEIREIAAGRAKVLQPEQAVIARLKSLLQTTA